MAKPLLSIGMIFKNEIRCLERCMKSLAPLREAVPCELVMADTGSTDGSREVAAKYADILFDFPWVNDFAAARNAVLDRCTGRWFMSIDADEWLDEDISQLLRFLRRGEKLGLVYAFPTIRNYLSNEECEYSDAYIARFAWMAAHPHYEGAIHESLSVDDGLKKKADVLSRVIFHHDGYRNLNTEVQAAKRERNMTMLRAELEKDPDELMRLLQFLESGQLETDYNDKLRHAVELVDKKALHWERFGPPIYRYAVMSAYGRGFPELETWIAKAEELFPDSYFIQIDAAQAAFDHSWAKSDYADCLRRGEQCLKAIADFNAGRGDQTVKLTSTVIMAGPGNVLHLKLFMAGAHVELGRPDRAREILAGLDGTAMLPEHAGNLAAVLQRLHYMTEQDDGPLLVRFWDEIDRPVPTPERGKDRRAAFLKEAAKSFLPVYFAKEVQDGALRHAYTLYEPLAGQCDVGTAAAILAAGSVPEMERLLGQVRDWAALPPLALEKALLSGVEFPLPGKPLRLEEMDALAAGLPADALYRGLKNAEAKSWQSRCWRRALALAAVQSCNWTDEAQGAELCRTFAETEREFLPQYYNPELLCDENIQVLPPLHRFGWYCGRAFEALDGGDAAGYVRLLRAGLYACESMKPMVEFLTDHTPELQAPKPSGELLALAEQVRTMLAAYPADDPAVLALKQSAAYQKAARLIEGPDSGALGGWKQ